MTVDLDLGDKAIREMVDRNHHPRELRFIDGSLQAIQCEACHQDWPCPTIRELRARKKDQERGVDPVMVVEL